MQKPRTKSNNTLETIESGKTYHGRTFYLKGKHAIKDCVFINCSFRDGVSLENPKNIRFKNCGFGPGLEVVITEVLHNYSALCNALGAPVEQLTIICNEDMFSILTDEDTEPELHCYSLPSDVQAIKGLKRLKIVNDCQEYELHNHYFPAVKIGDLKELSGLISVEINASILIFGDRTHLPNSIKSLKLLNGCADTVCDFIHDENTIEVFSMESRFLCDKVPSYFCKLKRLKELSLKGCSIVPGTLQPLLKLPRLQQLELCKKQIQRAQLYRPLSAEEDQQLKKVLKSGVNKDTECWSNQLIIAYLKKTGVQLLYSD